MDQRKRRMRIEPLEVRHLLSGQTIIETPLVQEGDNASYLVPSVANGGDQLAGVWHGAAFDDSSWNSGPTSFGFGELVPPLAIAEELLVDLRAADLAGADTATAAWLNRGTLGDFSPRGVPAFGPIDGATAVSFDGVDDWYEGPSTSLAPGLEGIDATRTIEVWAFNPSVLDEETLVSWSQRGGPDGSNMAFNYGVHPNWGAVGHWGSTGPDMGWIDNTLASSGAPTQGAWHYLVYTYDGTATRVYSDGQLWNSETLGAGAINTKAGFPLRIASQNDAGNGSLFGSLSIGQVRIHDGVLTDADVLNNFELEKGNYGFIEPDLAASPEELNIYHRFGSPDAGSAELTITNNTAASIDNVTFGQMVSPFDGPVGGPANAGSLAPGASVARTYEFYDDAPESGIPVTVTGDGVNPTTVSVNGVPVGPDARFRVDGTDVTETLEMHLDVSPPETVVAKQLNISNASTDGDRGELTDLTVSNITFRADPEGRFTLNTPLPTSASVLSVGDALQAIEVQFDSGGEFGSFGGAWLEIETDQGVAFDTRGKVFVIQLSADSLQTGVLPAEPLHRYGFNGSGTAIIDSIGGANGVLMGTGGSQAGGRVSLAGGAPNSGAAYVDLPNGLISGLTDATFEAWVTVDTVQSWSRIFDFGSRTATEAGGATGEIISAFGPNGNGETYVMLSANVGTGTNQRLEMRGNGGNQGFDSANTTAYGVEAHIVVTFDDAANELKYYRDGVPISTAGALSSLWSINDVNNWLGRSQWNDRNLDGSFDEFRIYDYALTQDQITANYQLGPSVVNVLPTTSLVADSAVVNIPARIGSGQSGSAIVSISNPGSDAIANVTFGTPGAPFSGPIDGTANAGTLAGGASVARSYAYLPDDGVPDVTTVQITGDGVDPETVTLNGQLVGPDVELRSGVQDLTASLLLQFTESEGQGLVSKPLSIGNNSGDGDFGALTDLTVVSTSFYGGPDGRFTLSGGLPAPGTTLPAGGSLALPAVQLDTDGGPGSFAGATLQIVTDKGAATGTAGETFTIQFSADVLEQGVLPNGLLHRYSFAETGGAGTQLIDSVGDAHGTIVDVGANDATVGGGQVTLAGGAKTASDYVDLPDGLVSGLTDATIELWATQESVQSWSRIFDFGSGTTDYLSMFWTRGGTNINQDGVEIMSEDDGGVLSRLNDSMQPYTLGQTFQIVMTIDQGGAPGGNTRIVVYKDGVREGILDSSNTLSDINDVNVWLGRSQFNDNTANASYDELRIYDTVLAPNQIIYSRDLGPDVIGTLPDPEAPRYDVGEWNFRFHDAGGNTQGTEVADGQNVGDGDLFNSSPFAPVEDAGNRGHDNWGTPAYRTYDVTAEGLAGWPDADGFAMDTASGYPYWNDGNSPLQQAVAANGTFSAWARAKRTADAPGTFEAILSRPNRWRLGIDADGTIVAEFGNPTGGSTVLDTGIAFNVDEWHDVGFTYDGTGAGDGTVTVYVDGQAAGSFTPPAFDTGDVFHIGNGPAGNWPFYGWIDRALFWETTVDGATMAALSPAVPLPPPTEAFPPPPPYGTDLAAEMSGVNASVFVRVPFTIAGEPDFDYLTLQMQYDDGFVAYVNGVEVAQANAPGRDGDPGTLGWDSTATAEQLPQQSLDFLQFTLSPDVLQAGDNVLAIHGLNVDAADSDFVMLPQLIGGTVPRDRVQPIPDSYVLGPDTVLTVDAAAGVLANDENPDGAPLSTVLVDDVGNGTLSLGADGAFSYTPALGHVGTDGFTYQIANLPGEPMIVAVTLLIDDPPVAVGDVYDAVEDTPLVMGVALGVLDNDFDVQDDPLTALLIDPPANGSVSLAADGSFTYTPNANYFGPDAFTYLANDGDQDSTPATVTLDVAARNDAPLAVADTYYAMQNETLSVAVQTGVLVNDVDVDGPALSAVLVDDAAGGTLTLSPDGSFTYEPGLDFIGTDSFTYRADDSLLPSDPVTVTLIVNSPEQAVVINEIFYDPDENYIHAEFIELFNAGNQTLNLTGWRFTDGVDFTFPPGTMFPPGEYLLVADDPAVIMAEFGQTALGPWIGRLSNDGERIELSNALGDRIDVVDYRSEFPWPIAANGDGASMELIGPSLDNNLAGSWRSSRLVDANGGDPVPEQVTYLYFADAAWRYRKGTSEPAGAAGDWRLTGYAEDASWLVGQTPIGYGDGDDATVLADMQNGYTSVYLRHDFTVAPGQIPTELDLTVYDDDGAIVWINGWEVARFNVTAGDKAFDDTANNHEAALEQVRLTGVDQYLVEGTNTIAIHALNQAVTSSDFSIDAQLVTPAPDAPEPGIRVPTPGEQNSIFVLNAPPQTRQVRLNDDTPRAGQEVILTAKVTDPHGVASVVAKVQVNEPGQYIPAFFPLDPATLQSDPDTPRPANPAFENPANWTGFAMVDDGTGADAVAGDGIYSTFLPGRINRSLVRYRIAVEDNLGAAVTVPYEDDPSLNFAYYVYDGLPDFVAETRSFQPGGAGTTYTADDLTDDSIAVYTLITRAEEIDAMMSENLPKPAAADALSNPTDTARLEARKTYNYEGAFVYDGKVYDHIRYRIRGSNSRYTATKRNLKFRFNRGDYLQARNIEGEKYANKWKTLVTGRMYGNKQVQNYGLVETMNSLLWQMFDVPARDTQFIHFRVVDGVEEAPAGTNGQYDGDFWGMMLGFEAYDAAFLDNHGLPEGNLYKMADFIFDGKEQQRYQAYGSVSNAEDYESIRWQVYTNSDTQWLRDNVNLDAWYRYHTVVDAIRHYDMFPEPTGRHRLKNLAWYFEPPTPANPYGKVQFLEYDSDASWGPNFNAGNDQVKNAIYGYGHTELQQEYRNYLREFRDLIWTEEVINGMIDRLAAPVTALSRADRDRWDGNPLSPGSQSYSLNSIEAKVADMKGFAFTGWSGGSGPITVGRATDLDNLANAGGDASAIPYTPTISYVGLPGYPQTSLTFQSSAFSDPQGSGTFAAIQWRVGEITDPTAPAYDAAAPWIYEYDAVWESGESVVFDATVSVPPQAVEVGRTYRARVRMQDDTGRWSHWSEPAEFTVEVPGNAADSENLVITEINYHPADPTPEEKAVIPTLVNGDFEFIEMMNISSETISVANVGFAPGSPVDFRFDDGGVFTLEAGERVLAVKNLAAFELRYGGQLNVAGEFTGGSLNNGGEQITLLDAFGEPIRSFRYNDRLSWPVTPDGYGFTLVLKDPSSNPDHENPFNWRASGIPGGSPAAEDVATQPEIVINEALTHTDPPVVDAVELFNPTGDPVDVGGWFLSDDDTLLMKYAIPAGTTIPAGETLVIYEDDDADPLTVPPADYFGGAFSLRSTGEKLILSSGDGVALTGYTHGFDFGAAANGVAFIRHVDSTGFEYFTAQAGTPGTTLGAANGSFRVGEVVITELHYNPDGADPLQAFGDEFIEIQNATARRVDLYDAVYGNGWRIDGLTFEFPPEASLDAGETALIVGINPEVFRTSFAVGPDVQIFGPYLGNLNNGGERIAILRPDAPGADLSVPYIDVDAVRFDDALPWPVDADGAGSSLSRLTLLNFGSDPASWTAATPTPGFSSLIAPQVVGRRLFYNNSAFDGNDPNAAASDDDAIATDKAALLPGNTATFANYSSFAGGINGVMVDLVGVAAPLLITEADFAFRVGNEGDPSTWPNAPAPTSVTVRPGQGDGGSDRVTVLWDDAGIVGEWLQVTVKSGGATGLVVDDVFYFGNAVGETGNSLGAGWPAPSQTALVNAADVIAIRDNPRGPLNPADVANPHDLNRDRSVDALDMILARDYATSPLTALRMITPAMAEPAPALAEPAPARGESGKRKAESDGGVAIAARRDREDVASRLLTDSRWWKRLTW